jgi:hypothetical protein
MALEPAFVLFQLSGKENELGLGIGRAQQLRADGQAAGAPMVITARLQGWHAQFDLTGDAGHRRASARFSYRHCRVRDQALDLADPAFRGSTFLPLFQIGIELDGTYEDAHEATIERARGWAVLRALGLVSIGRNGRLGLPGGKPTWEPAGRAALERALAVN